MYICGFSEEMQVQVKLMFFYNLLSLCTIYHSIMFIVGVTPELFKVSLILQKMFGVLYLLINGLMLLIGFCT